MQSYQSVTPFGGRTLTRAHIVTEAEARRAPADRVVHKWEVFRAACTARHRLGVTERALAVLDALLSFHPETTLSGQGLVVWPSNAQLALRAHGMAAATLRRHLACLVEAGLIIRRDSPNGKRYARRGEGGTIDQAFGFDLTPLVARADEINAHADAIRAENQALRLARERITLCRRDIAKMIAAELADDGTGMTSPEGAWGSIADRYRALAARIPRAATLDQIGPIADALAKLADEAYRLLEKNINFKNTSGSESQNERHIQNSKPDSPTESEPISSVELGGKSEVIPLVRHKRAEAYPLPMVLQACPDMLDYACDGIPNWREFIATAGLVRSMLGISPSAWEEAKAILGEVPAAIVIAAMLQRAPMITSAGGYLRSLTAKAATGQFSLGPMLMALIGSRAKGRVRA